MRTILAENCDLTAIHHRSTTTLPPVLRHGCQVQAFVSYLALLIKYESNGKWYYPKVARSNPVLRRISERDPLMQTLPLFLSLTSLLLASHVALAETAAGRISQVEGAVELRHHGKSISNAAKPDTFLTVRSRLMTRSHGRAELHIGGNRVRLDAESELELTEAGAQRVILKLHSGSVFIDSTNVAGTQRLELVTSSGRVQISEPGQVRIDSGGADATAVRLFSGAAQFTANGSNPVVLENGRQMVWRNGQISNSAIGPDAFDDWCLGRAAAGRVLTSRAELSTSRAEPVSSTSQWRSGPALVSGQTGHAIQPARETVYETVHVSEPSYRVTSYPAAPVPYSAHATHSTYSTYSTYSTAPAYSTYPAHSPGYVNSYPYWGRVALDVGLLLTLGHYWHRAGHGYYRHHGHHAGYRGHSYGPRHGSRSHGTHRHR